MKTMLLAAAVALSLGAGTAYAADSEGQAFGSNVYVFPGTIYAGAVQNAPPVATAQGGQAIQTLVTKSNQGTWLFPPTQNDNG